MELKMDLKNIDEVLENYQKNQKTKNMLRKNGGKLNE